MLRIALVTVMFAWITSESQAQLLDLNQEPESEDLVPLIQCPTVVPGSGGGGGEGGGTSVTVSRRTTRKTNSTSAIRLRQAHMGPGTTIAPIRTDRLPPGLLPTLPTTQPPQLAGAVQPGAVGIAQFPSPARALDSDRLLDNEYLEEAMPPDSPTEEVEQASGPVLSTALPANYVFNRLVSQAPATGHRTTRGTGSRAYFLATSGAVVLDGGHCAPRRASYSRGQCGGRNSATVALALQSLRSSERQQARLQSR